MEGWCRASTRHNHGWLLISGPSNKVTQRTWCSPNLNIASLQPAIAHRLHWRPPLCCCLIAVGVISRAVEDADAHTTIRVHCRIKAR